uniref:Uncharacterized protein n=1 Tax=Timema douglasi TaxID=61478 RepID=A0A7R8ZDP3_TIMDO|nr:unnamed protein product [Timema douglasi]
MGTQFIRVPLKRDVVAVVRPSIMKTSSGLESYTPKARQCFFSHEKHLLYFNVYTQGNCEMECLINITREVCGCTAFYVPSLDDVPVCGSGNLMCFSLLAGKLIN